MIRRTAQRDAIRSLFQPDTDPMSPQEILEHASKVVPTVGIATVYRTVRALVEQGEIVAVELPGEPPRYERAGKDHHHHFMCESCGRAFDIDACPGDLAHMTPKGYTLRRHEITLYGLCDACVDDS